MIKFITIPIRYFKKFFSGNFNQLLFFLILLFIFLPYDLSLQYTVLWHLFFSGVLLAGIFNCSHEEKIKIAGMVIGIPTLLLNWTSLFSPTEFLFVASQIASVIFLIFSIFSLLHRVLFDRVTADLLRGTICVYFMIGFAFAFIYALIEFFMPDSFKLQHPHSPLFGHNIYPSEMVYFSFVTMLAIGYGDIVPLQGFSQTLAVMEGIIGQFYLAIIVARLVSIYSLRQLSRMRSKD